LKCNRSRIQIEFLKSIRQHQIGYRTRTEEEKKQNVERVTSPDIYIMDTYYMSDCMSYGGSMRNPSYRDYEKFPYGSLESSLNSGTMKNTYNTMQGEKRIGIKCKRKVTEPA
jgi:hypothetical protein